MFLAGWHLDLKPPSPAAELIKLRLKKLALRQELWDSSKHNLAQLGCVTMLTTWFAAHPADPPN